MRTINITMSNERFNILQKIKGRRTWEEWIEDIIKSYKAKMLEESILKQKETEEENKGLENEL